MNGFMSRRGGWVRALVLAVGGCAVCSLLVGYVKAIDPYTGEGNPIVGAQVVASGGEVTATYLYGSGYYDDYLYLDVSGNAYQNANPNAIGSNWIFENHISSAGQTVNLGSFSAGTILTFNVLCDTHESDFSQDPEALLNWYTGPASLNADGFAHAWVDAAYTGPYGGTAVGFEDESGTTFGSSDNHGIVGPGDAGYEDLAYTFSNVKAVAVPDVSSTLSLLGASLVGLFAFARRVKNVVGM